MRGTILKKQAYHHYRRLAWRSNKKKQHKCVAQCSTSAFTYWKQAANIVPLLHEALTVPNPMCCHNSTEEMAAQ
ncbi:hypothetical protein GDO81_011685 [Engystomops pustulosus]|uniref:Uncharacterized protein n=1 Tax=Engystomops pustulosus TaxID=76066 RepID=A0AAV7BG91_ENGPU|nr:hypothetical protein GDO81_011685 [Engystomops pustulosus]